MKPKKIIIRILPLFIVLLVSLTACGKNLKDDLMKNSWYFKYEDDKNITQELDFTEDKMIAGVGMLKQEADYKVVDKNKIEMIEQSGRKAFIYFSETDSGYNLVIEYQDSKSNNQQKAQIYRRAR